MSDKETTALLSLFVGASLREQEGAGLLQAWAARGETGVELAATVRFLKENAVPVPVTSPCFDLCGTGGSGLTRYNVSTTVAFIAAAAGVPVAKHGNRGSRRANGSFDMLEELGVAFELTPEKEAQLQEETGVCFLFARTHHPAVGKVSPYRKAAACRSIFNLAGPLANPALIKHQIIGTANEATARVVADALGELKTEGALVVWGEPGIDEVSVTGDTGYWHINAEGLKRGCFEQATHPGLDYDELPGGDAPENAETFHALLGGTEAGPLLDMVCVNAGVSIDLWNGAPPSYEGPGALLARELVANGKALAVFEAHRKLSQEFAGH